MRMQPYKLMIPGPVDVSPEVLAAMGSPVQPHYGADWVEFYNNTLSTLKTIFGTAGDVFLMVGSGSCAIDACLGSSFCSGDKILVGMNGFFGDRLKFVAESYGLDVLPVTAEWGKPLRAEDFEAAFQNHPDAKGAAVVHLETSTTILNPIEQIGPVIRKHSGVFFVDAVSSLGGISMRMEDWCIDLCASATQKCLGAPPGLAPVAVGPRGWKAIDSNPAKGHGWYGDLRVWRQYAVEWGDWHPSPVTMATNNVVALGTALQQLMAEGIPQRLERYRRLALRLREGLAGIGMQPFTPLELMNPVITAAYGPKGVSTAKIVTHLAEKYHIKISGGLGALRETIFRIGHMSPVMTEADIDLVLDGLRTF